ncbi:MAG: MerR family transcriptional regulator [Spirochaetaceae bacterium]|nr:MerR family transcriptional regulator [Spirochaetaceae bacterium]
MAQFSIGEMEELTGVKQTVLRYWESVIPILLPKRDIGGHRVYSQRDMEIVLRLKYLIYTKRFTLEGAKKQLLAESTHYQTKGDILVALHDLRAQLIDLYLLIRKHTKEQKG